MDLQKKRLKQSATAFLIDTFVRKYCTIARFRGLFCFYNSSLVVVLISVCQVDTFVRKAIILNMHFPLFFNKIAIFVKLILSFVNPVVSH